MQIHMWIFIRPVLRNFSYWVACSMEVFKTTKLQILHFYFFTERNQNLNARFWFTGTIVSNVKKARVIICTSVISLNSNVFYFKVKSIIKQFLVYVTPHIWIPLKTSQVVFHDPPHLSKNFCRKPSIFPCWDGTQGLFVVQ